MDIVAAGPAGARSVVRLSEVVAIAITFLPYSSFPPNLPALTQPRGRVARQRDL